MRGVALRVLQQVRRRKFLALAGIVVLATGVLLMAQFSGYVIGRHQFGPFGFFQGAEYRIFGEKLQIARERREAVERRVAENAIQSIFVKLHAETGEIAIKRDGAGGGLTSFGDAVLVLTHEGKIFAARSATDIFETAIKTPDNGYQAYDGIAHSAQHRNLPHNVSYLRYNDIMYYQSEHQRGLAVSYTEFDEENICYRNTVAILPIDPELTAIEKIEAHSDDWDIVFRADPCLPFKKISRPLEGHLSGGRMAFRAPDKIYLASGDYGWDGVYSTEAISQKPGYDYGRIIEIDLFARRKRAITIGNRNTQGILIDDQGRTWVTEHGHRGGDELNLIVEGENYGWPVVSLGTRYSGLPLPGVQSLGRHEHFQAPVFAWLPSIAPSNLIVIDGFHEAWDGDLLVASLGNESLHRLRLSGDTVQFDERIHLGRRIRYVHQHTNGEIVLWTDDHELIFMSAANSEIAADFVARYLASSALSREGRARLQSAIENCAECHSFESHEVLTGPPLGDVYNDFIASGAYDGYSEALRTHGDRWTHDALMAFLANPNDYAPGTTMPDPGIDDRETLEDITRFLEALRAGE